MWGGGGGGGGGAKGASAHFFETVVLAIHQGFNFSCL